MDAKGQLDRDDVRRFLEARGGRGVDVVALAGGASLRRYWRATGDGLPGDEGAVVVMTLPRGGPTSEELGKGKPGASAGDDFVEMARWLESAGVPVPRLHHVDLEEGVLVLEDLGDERLYDAVTAGGDLEGLYLEALDLLAAFRAAVLRAPATSPGHGRTCDEAVLRAELDHFLEYGVEARQGRALAGAGRDELERAFDDVSRRLAAAPQALAHRDFQSQNLMRTPRGLVLLDFQDAFVAPEPYDLVALLRDSYVVLPPPLLERLLDHHHRRSGGPDPRPLFHLQTIQRKLKDAGRFEYIDKVKGNPGFLRFYGDSVAYAVAALARFPEYRDALAALAAVVPEAREARRALGV